MFIKNTKIFLELIKINIKKMLIYRTLFFTEFFTMLLWAAAYILLIEVIFLHTKTLAGWDKSQAQLILAFYYSFQTFGEVFYIDNFEQFSLNLRRGLIDFNLIKPVSSRLLTFLYNMQFQDLSHFIMTIGLFIYAIKNLPHPLDPKFFILGLLMVIPATILNFSIHSIFTTTAFWLQKNETLSSIMWNFRQTAKYPRQIYQGFFKIAFSFIIPFALLASIPAEVAMNFQNGPYPFIFLGLTIFFFYISKWFWNLGLKKYSSAN